MVLIFFTILTETFRLLSTTVFEMQSSPEIILAIYNMARESLADIVLSLLKDEITLLIPL